MRFVVSAFGLAMLMTQLAFPALVQAQEKKPSPVLAWPVGEMNAAAQAPIRVAQFPFRRPGNVWQRQLPVYQNCPPGATPVYPVYPQPETYPPQGAYPQPDTYPQPMQPDGQLSPFDGQPPPQDPGFAPPSQQPDMGQAPFAPQPQPQPQAADVSDAAVDQLADSLASDAQQRFAGEAQAIAPNMVGDNFGITGSSVVRQTVRAPNSVANFISGAPGNLNSVLGFDANPVSGDDTVSVGPGSVQFGQVVFQVAEPADGNILAGPDAPCFTYVGGTATSDDPAGFANPWDLELIYQCDAIKISSAGSNVGRIKTAEDVSPIPRDRVFFNYSLFTDVPLTGPGISVNRLTLGMEEAFADDTMSLELRMPMAVTLDSTYDVLDPSISSYEFGDLYLGAKCLLYARDNCYLSAGLSVSVPTADDSQIFFNDALLARINNRSVRVAPFVGGLINDDIFFAQGFVQVDVEVTGDDVFGDSTLSGNLVDAGKFHDPTLLYLDLQLGAWLMRDTRPTKWLTGVASIFELHYNRNLDSLDSVSIPAPATPGAPDISRVWTIGDPNADIDVLNTLAGIALSLRGNSSVSVTYGVPLTNNKQFDGELRVMLNRFL